MKSTLRTTSSRTPPANFPCVLYAHSLLSLLLTLEALNLEPKITPELVAEHGLSPEEYEKIKSILDREPSFTELGVFSVMDAASDFACWLFGSCHSCGIKSDCRLRA